MMKRACLLFSVLVTFAFAFACKKAPEVTSDTASTSSTTTESLAAATDMNVTVTFKGLVAHVLGKHQRAVVVQAPLHPHGVNIYGVTKEGEAVVQGLADGECPSSCSFTLNHMSLQLLNGKGEPLSGDLVDSDGTFNRIVPDLLEVDANAFKEGALANDFSGGANMTSTASWGYFDLRGGSASTTKHPCQAKLVPPDTTGFIDFPQKTSVKFSLPAGGVLRVTGTDNIPHDIPLTGPDVLIEIANDLSDSKVSHFHEYAKLSSTAGLILPKVVFAPTEACTAAQTVQELGGVPGCNDTRIGKGVVK